MRNPSVLLAALLVAITGCGTRPSPTSTGSNPLDPAARTGRFKVLMTDAPAHVEAVTLVVAEVRGHRAGDADGSWQLLSSDTAQVDLLALSNGVFTPLADAVVDAGAWDGVRLLLTDGCTVTVDGVTHPLKVPSGMQSGLKLDGRFTVPAGGVLALQLDFDAARSLHSTGNGAWMLQPVVRLLDAAVAGAIRGVVAPPGNVSGIDVVQGGVVVTTVVPSSDGTFVASVLPAGSYDLVIHHVVGADTLVHGVAVSPGSVTDLGTVSQGDGGAGGDRPRDAAM